MVRPYNADDRDIDVEQLPVVNLDEREFAIAEHIAAARNKTHLDIRGGTIHGDQSSHAAHETGVVGEFCHREIIGQIDNLRRQARCTNGATLVTASLSTPTSTDVKTTSTGMDVRSRRTKAARPRAGWFVQPYVLDESTVRLIGMASRVGVISYAIR